MQEHTHLPQTNQLSVLASTILLAYALTPFINIPATDLTLNLPFGVFSYSLNFSTIVSILVAALAAVGVDWLLRSHPHHEEKVSVQHSLLPALTAWVIGIPLSTLGFGLAWWTLFAMGGILLVLVFIAEYIVVDFSDVRFGPAAGGLNALSFALFLILTISIRTAGLRLYLALPAVALPIFLISLRTLYLRSNGQWRLVWAAGITLVVVQIAIGLQYLPVSPLGYGLYLVGPGYAITNAAVSLEEGRTLRSFWLEPVVIVVLLMLLAFAFGG
jgi:hypothetical protein